MNEEVAICSPAGSQVGADRARGVGLVGQNTVGPGARSPDAQAGEQWQHHRSIAGLPRGEQDDQRAATAVDRGVDLRAQPAARPAESVIARFVPAAARILVIQPSHYVLFEPRTILPNNTFGDGRVLMRPHDRGIDRHRPIDPASSVGLGLDHSQQHAPGPVGSETMMPLPHLLPRAESLGKITPRHPGAITENDPLDHLAMITPRTRPPLCLRHQRLDPSLRRLAEFC
jgi:hypothetical protein